MENGQSPARFHWIFKNTWRGMFSVKTLAIGVVQVLIMLQMAVDCLSCKSLDVFLIDNYLIFAYPVMA